MWPLGGLLGWLNPFNILSGASAGLSGLIGALFGIALVIWAFRWRGFRRFILLVLAVPPAILLYLVGIIAIPLWRPVDWLTDRLLRFIPLDRMISGLLAIPARISRAPLLVGDRRAAAEAIWPPASYPELYAAAPADLYRPPYEDGRLLGGHPMSWLADRFLSDSIYRSSVRAGFKAGLLFFCLLLLSVLFGTLLSVLAFFPALFHGQRLILEQWPGEAPIRTSAWTLFTSNLGTALANLAGHLGMLLLYLPAAAMMAIGAAILISLLLLRVWFREMSAPYAVVTKDADVRWPHRIESRNLLRQTYRRQLAHALDRLKDKRTFHVGQATGTLRVRGDLAAPMPGQAIVLDEESLFQHTLVFGGTGEGKTTALLKPVMAQVLADRQFGAFIVDAKGVLWHDARAIAARLGRAEDVVVIGTGDGAVGVNVMANLSPSQVAAVLRSILAQIGGGSGHDSFWPDMAAAVLRHMLTIGRGYSLTAAGAAETAKGLNPYSLWWAYQAVLRPEPADTAIGAIRTASQTIFEAIKDATDEATATARTADLRRLMNPELSDSIAYVESAWRDMAAQTKTGIIANATSLLDGLAGSTALRERFASGRNEDAIPISDALNGKLVLIALSSIEDGLPARLISILLKTALYREARKREEAARHDSKAAAPQTHPCLVGMDEVQELVTVDPASGLSDATFWNVARSTGLAGLFATQTLSALTQAMGENAALNFVQQARSKVFFRTEEQGTVDYACWCAGAYERNRVYEEGQRESIEYRTLIDGWNPLAPTSDGDSLAGGPRAFFEAAKGLLNPDRVSIPEAASQSTYAADNRFIATDATPGGSSGGTASNSARMNSLQAAAWRAEDLTRQYRSNGNDRQAALSPSDMIHMGRWHAFAHVQRAGTVRQDIIAVQHDFG